MFKYNFKGDIHDSIVPFKTVLRSSSHCEKYYPIAMTLKQLNKFNASR